jgi:hypothetical protein
MQTYLGATLSPLITYMHAHVSLIRLRENVCLCVQLLTQWRQGLQAGGSDIVKDLFQVQMQTVLQCSESEETVSETNTVRILDANRIV